MDSEVLSNIERAQAQRQALTVLQHGGVENAQWEARWMVDILCRRCQNCPGEFQPLLEEWLRRRCAGEPFQYIVGSVEFYNLELQVGPGVLIPRPETEELVERALEIVKKAPAGSMVLDLCTGSGAIPLAMAKARPDLRFIGVDISPAALTWAKRNLEMHGLQDCVEFLLGDLCAPLPKKEQFFLVTANPPYVSPDEYAELPAVVKEYEPRNALEAAEDGLALEKRTAQEALEVLLPGGNILLEIGENQGAAMEGILKQLGYQQVQIHRDLSGRHRIAQGTKPHGEKIEDAVRK